MIKVNEYLTANTLLKNCVIPLKYKCNLSVEFVRSICKKYWKKFSPKWNLWIGENIKLDEQFYAYAEYVLRTFAWLFLTRCLSDEKVKVRSKQLIFIVARCLLFVGVKLVASSFFSMEINWRLTCPGQMGICNLQTIIDKCPHNSHQLLSYRNRTIVPSSLTAKSRASPQQLFDSKQHRSSFERTSYSPLSNLRFCLSLISLQQWKLFTNFSISFALILLCQSQLDQCRRLSVFATFPLSYSKATQYYFAHPTNSFSSRH